MQGSYGDVCVFFLIREKTNLTMTINHDSKVVPNVEPAGMCKDPVGRSSTTGASSIRCTVESFEIWLTYVTFLFVYKICRYRTKINPPYFGYPFFSPS